MAANLLPTYHCETPAFHCSLSVCRFHSVALSPLLEGSRRHVLWPVGPVYLGRNQYLKAGGILVRQWHGSGQVGNR